MKRSATMKDVAAAAGVSLGTVSNVINGNKSVKQENRERVETVMREIEFVPNSIARQLRSNKGNVLGLIIPTILNPYYNLLAQGIGDAAVSNGMNMFLSITNRDVGEEVRMLEELISKQVSGIAIAKSYLSSKQLAEYSKRTKLVLLDTLPYEYTPVDIVSANDYCAMLKAVDYLCSLGHTRIAYLAGDMLFVSAKERKRGFLEGMSAHGFDVADDFLQESEYTIEGGFAAALHLIKSKVPPTAIICANEMLAIGVYRAARKSGLSIPGDISVVGCDNTLLAEVSFPELTTIDQKLQEQGLAAVKLLLGSNLNAGATKRVFNCELMIRESCAPCTDRGES